MIMVHGAVGILMFLCAPLGAMVFWAGFNAAINAVQASNLYTGFLMSVVATLVLFSGGIYTLAALGWAGEASLILTQAVWITMIVDAIIEITPMTSRRDNLRELERYINAARQQGRSEAEAWIADGTPMPVIGGVVN
jgi:hypothetical protein